MTGEQNLTKLLANMNPILVNGEFVFTTVPHGSPPLSAIAMFHEVEGLSIILPRLDAVNLGLSYEGTWALITLQINSSLSAVGFMAQITTRLAAAGIAVNPVSAYYHDHLFVPYELRQIALKTVSAGVNE